MSQSATDRDAERAEWLADKIPAYGDYAKEAAQMLRQYAIALRSEIQRSDMVLVPRLALSNCLSTCDRFAIEGAAIEELRNRLAASPTNEE